VKTLKVTASKKPNQKEREAYLQFMRTEQIGRVVIVNKETGEETVLEVEQKDAEGRTLLHG